MRGKQFNDAFDLEEEHYVPFFGDVRHIWMSLGILLISALIGIIPMLFFRHVVVLGLSIGIAVIFFFVVHYFMYLSNDDGVPLYKEVYYTKFKNYTKIKNQGHTFMIGKKKKGKKYSAYNIDE